MKNAFPDDKKGEISVAMKRSDKELVLIVKDNGVGMSEVLDWKKTSSLGLKLVRTLVENQLDGSISFDKINFKSLNFCSSSLYVSFTIVTFSQII